MTGYNRKLREIRINRFGLSLNKFAKLIGYKSASSVQRYETEEFSDQGFPATLITRLHERILGMGTPPVSEEEILELGLRDFSAISRSNRGTDNVDLTRLELAEKELIHLLDMQGAVGKAIEDLMAEKVIRVDHRVKTDMIVALVMKHYFDLKGKRKA